LFTTFNAYAERLILVQNIRQVWHADTKDAGTVTERDRGQMGQPRTAKDDLV
jgi:hypothetical protein